MLLQDEELDYYGEEFVRLGIRYHGLDLSEYIARRTAESPEGLLQNLHRERVLNPSLEVRAKNHQFRAAKKALQGTRLKFQKRK